MLKIKVKGRRKPMVFAEWKDCEKIVERHLKKNKKFYEQLAEL